MKVNNKIDAYEVKYDFFIKIFRLRQRNLINGDPSFDASFVIGRVSYGLVKVGYILNFLRSPAGLISAVYLPSMIVIWMELKRLAQSCTRPTYRRIG